jgi:hypothetical protein
MRERGTSVLNSVAAGYPGCQAKRANLGKRIRQRQRILEKSGLLRPGGWKRSRAGGEGMTAFGPDGCSPLTRTRRAVCSSSPGVPGDAIRCGRLRSPRGRLWRFSLLTRAAGAVDSGALRRSGYSTLWPSLSTRGRPWRFSPPPFTPDGCSPPADRPQRKVGRRLSPVRGAADPAARHLPLWPVLLRPVRRLRRRRGRGPRRRLTPGPAPPSGHSALTLWSPHSHFSDSAMREPP